MTRPMGISLAVLLGFAAVFGAIWGLRAIPPGETEIINGVAAEYVAATGGALSDCFARPSALDGVRMVVICERDTAEAWVRAVDAYGRAVEIGPDTLAEEGQT